MKKAKMLVTTAAQCESLLRKCSSLQSFSETKKLHAFMLTLGLFSSPELCSKLATTYAQCHHASYASHLFKKLPQPSLFSWNAMMRMYVQIGRPFDALNLFVEMLDLGQTLPDKFTYPVVIKACGDLSLIDVGVGVHGQASCGSLVYLKHGKCLHAWAIRQKLDSEVIVETALIDMYAKCNHGNVSYKVFMGTSKKRTAPWNALLSGFVQNKLAVEAIKLFKQMLVKSVQPDNATCKSLLPAYAILADLLQAMNIHSYLMKSGFIYRLEQDGKDDTDWGKRQGGYWSVVPPILIFYATACWLC
ncbi:Pentatricopeptide repeat-containing protein [Vigna angularis]|uniref:Pentatricopeptide repeat-containing protein n=1 Tax=Phaseolus angularis TaxID=3914 RepID=A0A8T0JMD2_PHAAN|nr:Pentatricopeptide repeat-containing protein [Vigna angularis]